MKKEFKVYNFVIALFLAIATFVILFHSFSVKEVSKQPKGKNNWEYEDGTIVSSVKISTGCMYTLKSGMTFTDKGCRYNIGEVVEPYQPK